jgi:hypothetical protein
MRPRSSARSSTTSTGTPLRTAGAAGGADGFASSACVTGGDAARRDAHLTALGELQRVRKKVAQDLRNLAFVRVQHGQLRDAFEHQLDGRSEQQRPEHAAQRAEQVRDRELARAHRDLARLDLREVEEIVDELQQLSGALLDIPHLALLLRFERAVGLVGEQAREPQNRVERRAELVAHVRKEFGLELVGPAQVVRSLVELRIKRQHAAIGVRELRVHPRQLALALLELVERRDQLVVLLLQLFEQGLRTTAQLLFEGGRDRGEVAAGVAGRRARQDLLQRDVRASRGAAHLAAIDEPAGADDAEPHARRRAVGTAEHGGQIRDARALVGHVDRKKLRRRISLDTEIDAAAAGVAHRVARDLGYRGGNARLILGIEPERGRNLARSLARRDHVVLESQSDGEQTRLQDRLSFESRTATTVASSRPRS